MMISKDDNLKENKLYPEFLISKVNDNLRYYLEKYERIPVILKEAISYTIESGGKRFRPILCMITAKSLGQDFKIVMPTACAIEFIHTYSLIHDDLPSIDNDDLRRGKPTCHKKFGEDIAILTGDALFSEAFNIILKYQIADAETKVKILGEIADATGVNGMAAGQIIDVYYTGKKISKDRLEYMHKNKTGRLITASVRCAAVICGASSGYIKKLTDYSENLGLAFQITDDILDVTSNRSTAGKATGKDAVYKKNTYPDMWGISKSKKIAERKIKKSIEIIESIDIEHKWLVNIAKFLLLRKV
jgi:geranylgeranyl diphosphate synthase type II